ncbi:MAG TPA: tRNA pseudouridine synthase A [Flavipsychrobacter sp.]|nr:tRNA pseudouridine synthase A [Flavipsychrobacter sp.]
MARYVLEVMYDGTHFHGSQLQGELPTVQWAINKALSTLLREKLISFGASRTDEGVHALSNFYHFDTEQELNEQFRYRLNAILPSSLSVKNVYQAENNEFNVRFDALSRTYRYRIYSQKNPFYYQKALYYPFKINEKVLHETSELLKGYTDFESFSKRNTQSYTFQCSIFESFWEERGDQLHYVVKANRFLRGMVRGLVSTQLQAARNRFSVEDFVSIIEAKDCTRADFSVAGHGLYLEAIEYPGGSFK